MAQQFDLNIRYKLEDRALVRSIRQQLAEAKRLDSVLAKLKGSIRQLSQGFTGQSGAKKLAKDFDAVTRSIRAARTEAQKLNTTIGGGTSGAGTRGAAASMGRGAGPMAFLGRAAAPYLSGYAAYRGGRVLFDQYVREDAVKAEARTMGITDYQSERIMKIANTLPVSRTDIVKAAYAGAQTDVPLQHIEAFSKQAALFDTTSLDRNLERSAMFLAKTAASNYQITGDKYWLTPDAFKRISDVGVQTTRYGAVTSAQLAEQSPDFLAMATQSGISLEEAFTAYMRLTKSASNPAEAATQMTGIMNGIWSPSEQSASYARDVLGIELSPAAMRKHGGFFKYMEKLSNAIGKQQDPEDALGQVFGNIRGLKGMLGAFGNAEGAVHDLTTYFSEAAYAGATATQSSIMTANAQDKLTVAANESKDRLLTMAKETGIAQASVQALGVAMGVATLTIEGLGYTVGAVGDAMGKVVDFLQSKGLLKDAPTPTEVNKDILGKDTASEIRKVMGLSTDEDIASSSKSAQQKLIEKANADIRAKVPGPLRAPQIKDLSELKNPDIASILGPNYFPSTSQIGQGGSQGDGVGAFLSVIGQMTGVVSKQEGAATAHMNAAKMLTQAAITLAGVKIGGMIFGGGGTGPKGSGGFLSTLVGNALGSVIPKPR